MTDEQKTRLVIGEGFISVMGCLAEIARGLKNEALGERVIAMSGHYVDALEEMLGEDNA